METTKIVDLIMKDHLSDASDAVKDVIMNKAAEILTLEKEKVGADMFAHLDPAPAEDPNGSETELNDPNDENPVEDQPTHVPAPDENETNN
tara:strand:+ start:1765 stop:2037 length:273 start_codon:yes stop_codon:yes gene_type:complete